MQGNKFKQMLLLAALTHVALASFTRTAQADDAPTLPTIPVSACPIGQVPVFSGDDYSCSSGGSGKSGGTAPPPGGGVGGVSQGARPSQAQQAQANKCANKFGRYMDSNGTKHIGPKPGFSVVFSGQHGWVGVSSGNTAVDVMPTSGPQPTSGPGCGGIRWREDVGTTIRSGGCPISGNLSSNSTYIWVTANTSPLLLAETLSHEYAAEWGASQQEVNKLDASFEAAYKAAGGNCN